MVDLDEGSDPAAPGISRRSPAETQRECGGGGRQAATHGPFSRASALSRDRRARRSRVQQRLEKTCRSPTVRSASASVAGAAAGASPRCVAHEEGAALCCLAWGHAGIRTRQMCGRGIWLAFQYRTELFDDVRPPIGVGDIESDQECQARWKLDLVANQRYHGPGCVLHPVALPQHVAKLRARISYIPGESTNRGPGSL